MSGLPFDKLRANEESGRCQIIEMSCFYTGGGETPLHNVACPLCFTRSCRFLHRSDDRHGVRVFYECAECDLAFVPPQFHLPVSAEIDRYRMHDNDPADAGYRRFLSRLWDELKPRLRAGSAGLDFGCGPGPALAHMMREDGFDARLYDPHFFPDRAALDLRYGFITCTETAEHLRAPSATFDLLDSLIVPGGQLGVMTGMLDNRAEFGSWYYQRDPTHIAFYTRRTMLWIAEKMGWSAEFPAANVTIFTKRVGLASFEKEVQNSICLTPSLPRKRESNMETGIARFTPSLSRERAGVRVT